MMRPVHPLVLRTDDLAGITAIEAVADFELKFIIHIAFGLRDEGDAAARVQLPRADQRPCRTSIDANRAVSALVHDRCIGLNGIFVIISPK